MSNNLTEELLEFCNNYTEAFESGNEEALTECYYEALRLQKISYNSSNKEG